MSRPAPKERVMVLGVEVDPLTVEELLDRADVVSRASQFLLRKIRARRLDVFLSGPELETEGKVKARVDLARQDTWEARFQEIEAAPWRTLSSDSRKDRA